MRWPVRSIRASFLKLEVEQLARERALVALDWRRWGKLRQAETMAPQEAGDAGFGEFGSACDLEARQLAATQCQDARDAERVGGSGGTFWARTAVVEAGGAFVPEAGEPFVGAALGDAEAGGHLGDGLPEIDDTTDHLGSTERGEFGLTVVVHAAVVLGLVLISQSHLSKSSPHEQPIGTSQLERCRTNSKSHAPNPN